MAMTKLVLLGFSIGFLAGLEVLPEMPNLEYYNKKYIRYMHVMAGRQSRRSPYYINLDLETLTEFGNNLTLRMDVLEYLSGRYHPTPLQGTYKLCDFLYNEPFMGKMYAKQIPFNWTCPFPAGEYNFSKFVIHLENFPFRIPFTSSSVNVKTRTDVKGYHTNTGELIVKCSVLSTIIQKPEKLKKNQD